jgi:hypothetical protein
MLAYGANINLDFDSMKPLDNTPTMALAIVLELTKNEQGDEQFAIIEKYYMPMVRKQSPNHKTLKLMIPPQRRTKMTNCSRKRQH